MRLTFGRLRLRFGNPGGFSRRPAGGDPPRAFQLLELLIGGRPRALSKEELHERSGRRRSFRGAACRLAADLRKASGRPPRNPRVIRTVHRFGYAFCAQAGPCHARRGRRPCSG